MWITDNRKRKEEDIYHEITLDGIKRSSGMGKADIKLPGYDVEAVSKKAKEAPGGYILESETFSVFSSVGLQTDFWKKVSWIEALPVWRPLITM